MYANGAGDGGKKRTDDTMLIVREAFARIH